MPALRLHALDTKELTQLNKLLNKVETTKTMPVGRIVEYVEREVKTRKTVKPCTPLVDLNYMVEGNGILGCIANIGKHFKKEPIKIADILTLSKRDVRMVNRVNDGVIAVIANTLRFYGYNW